MEEEEEESGTEGEEKEKLGEKEVENAPDFFFPRKKVKKSSALLLNFCS